MIINEIWMAHIDSAARGASLSHSWPLARAECGYDGEAARRPDRAGIGGRPDPVPKLLILVAGENQAGQVEHLVAGQPAGDRHNHVRARLDSNDRRQTGPADYSRDRSYII
jgi:hypothetical protein